MRILLSANHRYPAARQIGVGRRPKTFPSGAPQRIHDLIARGLAERGHEVLYLLPESLEGPLPPGVRKLSKPTRDIDIFHGIAYRDSKLLSELEESRIPWVATCHVDRRIAGKRRWTKREHWIFVSRTLANSHSQDRFVLNGLDPNEYLYSEEKDSYLLFLGEMDRLHQKGLTTALWLSRKVGIRLVVGGTARSPDTIQRVARICRKYGADYLGDVQGAEKARLLSRARALIFPTRINEAFGLVMAEALMSGTPVICSTQGACGEVVSPEVGFLCRTTRDYLEAVERVVDVKPEKCRARALGKFHYHRMVSDYLVEYSVEIEGGRGRRAS